MSFHTPNESRVQSSLISLPRAYGGGRRGTPDWPQTPAEWRTRQGEAKKNKKKGASANWANSPRIVENRGCLLYFNIISNPWPIACEAIALPRPLAGCEDTWPKMFFYISELFVEKTRDSGIIRLTRAARIKDLLEGQKRSKKVSYLQKEKSTYQLPS